ncbi:MAG: hypothetical protein J6C46_09100 [Clostridia bacterium]|nr:hypothetical protein [Clostridia bacterium]
MMNNTNFYPMGYNEKINMNLIDDYKYNPKKYIFISNNADNTIQKKENKIKLGERTNLWM